MKLLKWKAWYGLFVSLLTPIKTNNLDIYGNTSGSYPIGAENRTIKPHHEEIDYEILNSPYFDAAFYSASSSMVFDAPIDAARHYREVGEAANIRPSANFDPAFYRDISPDLLQYQRPLLLHYTDYGYKEGRAPFLSSSIEEGHRSHDPRKQTIAVVVHESSMTGAPILGYNIAKHLSEKYNIISIIMKAGELTENFRKISIMMATAYGVNIGSLDPRTIAIRLLAPMDDQLKIDAVVANSAETESVIRAAYYLNIPCLTLVHEFTNYVLPSIRMQNIINYSHILVFSSFLTEMSARESGLVGDFRHAVVIPQGKSEIPPSNSDPKVAGRLAAIVERACNKRLLCIGCGYVQPRKGVDLFIAAAAKVVEEFGQDSATFLWVGDGYDPEKDYQTSIWLKDQIERSGLKDVVEIIPAVGAEDLERLYRQADVMFLSSRLDPLPNVAIDAVHAGLPIVCFEAASGMAEHLAKLDGCRDLVVPYLDIHAAAAAIVKLTRDPDLRLRIVASLQILAAKSFDMGTYVNRLQHLVDNIVAINEQEQTDVEFLLSRDVLDEEMIGSAVGIYSDREDMTRRFVRFSSANTNRSAHGFRRPAMGFSPQAYEDHHPELQEFPFPNSVAHWARAGCPDGPWTHEVLSLNKSAPLTSKGTKPSVALHIHLHHPEFSEELLSRIEANRLRPELLISVTADEALQSLRKTFARYTGALADIRLVPNRGRDMGPFLVEFSDRLRNFDIIGHLHGKKSANLGSDFVGLWREFLFGTLVGGPYTSMDQITAAMQEDPSIGLMFPEDPNVVGWQANRAMSKSLVNRLNLGELPQRIEFPVGNMFYARTAALTKLFEAGFTHEELPAEPVPYDGTMLHAFERLTPIIAKAAGYRVVTVHAPGIKR